MQTLKISALALLMSSTALIAGPVDDKIAELEAMGYSNIETQMQGGFVEIEADGPMGERTILIDPESGDILSDDTEAPEADDDDEGMDSEDEADEDEDADEADDGEEDESADEDDGDDDEDDD